MEAPGSTVPYRPVEGIFVVSMWPLENQLTRYPAERNCPGLTEIFRSTRLFVDQQERSDSNAVHRFWRPSPLPGEHSCMAEAQRTELLRLLIFELYYPVGLANELRPDLHTIHTVA